MILGHGKNKRKDERNKPKEIDFGCCCGIRLEFEGSTGMLHMKKIFREGKLYIRFLYYILVHLLMGVDM